MLIQNNSDNIVTKYISIYLRETFNNSIDVSSIYSNSPYNYFKTGEDIFFNKFVAHYDISINEYVYGYVIGEIGTVIPLTYVDEDNKPYLKIAETEEEISFDTELIINNAITIRKINPLNGEFLIGIDGNYLTDMWTEGTTMYVSRSFCRKSTDLCAYIYQWLEDRYFPLFANSILNYHNKEYSLNEIIDNNIANYFASDNKTFNVNKNAFDIDDLVGSFLLGRTISDSSTPEEIQYAQNLLSKNHYLQLFDRTNNDFSISNYVTYPGVWGNLHELIYIYQKNLNARYSYVEDTKQSNTDVVLPTGYLDIVTEKYLLMEFEGQDSDNYFGESDNTMKTY